MQDIASLHCYKLCISVYIELPCGSTTVVSLSSPPTVNGRKQVKETGSPVKLAGSILTLSLEAVWFTVL